MLQSSSVQFSAVQCSAVQCTQCVGGNRQLVTASLYVLNFILGRGTENDLESWIEQAAAARTYVEERRFQLTAV